jgi:hypothetical protein
MQRDFSKLQILTVQSPEDDARCMPLQQKAKATVH